MVALSRIGLMFPKNLVSATICWPKCPRRKWMNTFVKLIPICLSMFFGPLVIVIIKIFISIMF